MSLTNKELYEIVKYMFTQYQKEYGNRNLQVETATLCLLDEGRTLTLMDIISQTVIPGSVGVDLGAGTGILGFAFLNAGGRFLYSVERVEHWTTFIDIVATKLGVRSRMEIHTGDVTTFKPPDSIDYVIAELVVSGLVGEPLVPAMHSIRRYVGTGTLYIPKGAKSTLAVADLHGKRITDSVAYDEVDFSNLIRTGVNTSVELEVTNLGVPWSIEIDTTLSYPGGHTTTKFDTLCRTKAIRIDRQNIHRGPEKGAISELNGLLVPKEKVEVGISYKYGAATSNIITTLNRC